MSQDMRKEFIKAMRECMENKSLSSASAKETLNYIAKNHPAVLNMKLLGLLSVLTVGDILELGD
jgi:hypothetical protein